MYYGIFFLLWLCSFSLSSSTQLDSTSIRSKSTHTHSHASTNSTLSRQSSKFSTSSISGPTFSNSTTSLYNSTFLVSKLSSSLSSSSAFPTSTPAQTSSSSSHSLRTSSQTFPTSTTVSSTSSFSTNSTTSSQTTITMSPSIIGPQPTTHTVSKGHTVYPFLKDFVSAGTGGGHAVIHGYSDVLSITAGILAEMTLNDDGEPEESPVSTGEVPTSTPSSPPSSTSTSSSSSSLSSSSSSLSSSSSTTSSTASTSPTPYVVRPKKGLSNAELDTVTAVLNQIAEQGTVEAVEGSDYISLWVASLTGANATKIASNPSVLAVFEDDLIPFDYPPPLNETRSGWERRSTLENLWEGSSNDKSQIDTRLTKRADNYIKQEYALRDIGILSLPERVPLAQDDGFDYPSEAGKGVTVYIIDTGVNTSHPEWRGGGQMRGSRRQILLSGETVMNDPFGHGTCVMSKVAGKLYGTAKGANIVMVKLPEYHAPEWWKWTPQEEMDVTFRVSSILKALIAVKTDIKDKNLQGKAVVNMAFAWTPDPPAERSNRQQDQLDSYKDELRDLRDLGAVLVTASGNARDQMSQVNSYPAKFGFGAHPLPVIVVGAVDLEGVRTSYSQGLSELHTSAPGNVLCANYQSDGGIYDYGTSFAAAAVSGIAATLLSQKTTYPNLYIKADVPYIVRDLIVSLSYKRKGYARNPVPDDELPTVAWNGVDNYPQNSRARSIKGHSSRGFSNKRYVYEPGASGDQRTSDMKSFNGFSWNVCLFSDNTDVGISITTMSTNPYNYKILSDCYDGDYQMNFVFDNGTETAFDLNGNTDYNILEVDSTENNSTLVGYFITGTQY